MLCVSTWESFKVRYYSTKKQQQQICVRLTNKALRLRKKLDKNWLRGVLWIVKSMNLSVCLSVCLLSLKFFTPLCEDDLKKTIGQVVGGTITLWLIIFLLYLWVILSPFFLFFFFLFLCFCFVFQYFSLIPFYFLYYSTWFFFVSLHQITVSRCITFHCIKYLSKI